MAKRIDQEDRKEQNMIEVSIETCNGMWEELVAVDREGAVYRWSGALDCYSLNHKLLNTECEAARRIALTLSETLCWDCGVAPCRCKLVVVTVSNQSSSDVRVLSVFKGGDASKNAEATGMDWLEVHYRRGTRDPKPGDNLSTWTDFSTEYALAPPILFWAMEEGKGNE